MQRLGGCLLLLLLAAKKEAGTLQVRQDPAQILAPLGSLVELSCRIEAAEHWERLRVEWKRESALRALCQVVLRNASITNCCKGMEGCDDARLGFTWHPPKFTLRMGNISKDDVGQYICIATMDIPMHLEAKGNGTMLNISADGGGWLRNHSRDLVLWLGLAGALAVTTLLLLPAVICCYKCRRRDPGQAIYVNVLFRKKQEEMKDSAQASSEMKQSSIYIREFQRLGTTGSLQLQNEALAPRKLPKRPPPSSRGQWKGHDLRSARMPPVRALPTLFLRF
ncbi:transmembrane and immunoglobulin domain-containing protein 2 isoform X2 [Dermochelys coriacea]|uniref:transmembrane and immunoglobulin domain-containing protein 2 isoform X2 n=1 Tax=Dermochelys coriacea TaxID=27794 RepID=UPI001CA8A063|nr:transmembrane and immunoglobulin domain-containing protein 2 isoform X2 [Dermochelys coriacea]